MRPYFNTHLGVSKVVWTTRDDTSLLGLFLANSSNMKECTCRALKLLDLKYESIFGYPFESLTNGMYCKRWCDYVVPRFSNEGFTQWTFDISRVFMEY